MNMSHIKCMLLLFSLFTCCARGDDVDPIKSWKNLGLVNELHLGDTVTAEYRTYIATLPPKERKLIKDMDALDILDVWYKEDGAGQHALQIDVPLNGTYWHHVLIYDKTNKRTKVIIYQLGHYAC